MCRGLLSFCELESHPACHALAHSLKIQNTDTFITQVTVHIGPFIFVSQSRTRSAVRTNTQKKQKNYLEKISSLYGYFILIGILLH